ncbi:MAG: hypothetical protein DRI30_07465, partial [Chloroflexi bacterium]
MSAEPADGGSDVDGRRVERWALLGVAAVVLLAIAAVLKSRPGPEDGAAADDDSSTVTVVIGGEGAPDPGPRPLPRDDPARPPEDDPGGETTPPPPVIALREYVVRKDDTLGAIAQRELGSARRVAEIVE